MKFKRKQALIIAITICGVVASYLCYIVTVPKFKRTLPFGITEVNEHGHIWLKSNYKLKAKLNEKQYNSYISKFKLKPYANIERLKPYENNVIWSKSESNDWWNPTSQISGTLAYLNQVEKLLVKYENGYLYLKYTSD